MSTWVKTSPTSRGEMCCLVIQNKVELVTSKEGGVISRAATHELVRGKNPSCRQRHTVQPSVKCHRLTSSPISCPLSCLVSSCTHPFFSSLSLCIITALTRKMSQLAVTLFGVLAVASRAKLVAVASAKTIIRQHLTCVTFSHLGMLSLEHTAVCSNTRMARVVTGLNHHCEEGCF